MTQLSSDEYDTETDETGKTRVVPKQKKYNLCKQLQIAKSKKVTVKRRGG